MNSDTFDLIARKISEIASRRSVVRRIVGGGAVTALAGFSALHDAEAKNKKKKKKKKRKDKKRKNNCKKTCSTSNPCEEASCNNKGKCKTQNQPDGTTCGEGLICEGGECVCPAGEKFCDGACIPEDDPCFVAVTESNLQGWLLEGEDAFSQDPSLTQIVSGPDTPPPPGEGSVKLDPTAFGPFAENQTQAVLRTLQYAGTEIGDIDRLQYSIYVPSTAGDPPTMQLAIVGTFNTDEFASLVFIPGLNGNTAPTLDDWTDYTPSQSGNWAATRDILDGEGDCLIRCSIGGCGTREAVCDGEPATSTWSEIQAGIPDAELNGSDPDNEGSFSFRIGRGDTGEGNVTNIVFNDDGYFFED